MVKRRRDGSDSSDKGKCLAYCIVRKDGYVEDGKLNEAALLKDVPSGVTVDIGLCRDLTGIDDCDTFYKIFKCFDNQLMKRTSG